jgi:hypothetical protein
MRLAPLVLLAVLALAIPALGQEPPAKLAASLAACETGEEPGQRFAVFTASMPALRGTHRMAMRFDLQERRGLTRSGFARVEAPKFGRWERSRPGVAGFVYTKRVKRLASGRWYRAAVRFRWADDEGEIQRTTRRVTAVCHQPDRRANLVLDSMGATRSSEPGRQRYLVSIENAGLTPADASTVAVEPRPEASFERPVPPLAPGERTTVVVEADVCEGSHVVVVQLDAGRVVDESREDDNRVEQACPAP